MGEEPRQFRIMDEVETIKFREQTNTALLFIKESIEQIKNSVKDVKDGLWRKADSSAEKMEEHDDRLARIETSLGMMVKVMWVIVTCSVGMVMTAFYKLILK